MEVNGVVRGVERTGAEWMVSEWSGQWSGLDLISLGWLPKFNQNKEE